MNEFGRFENWPKKENAYKNWQKREGENECGKLGWGQMNGTNEAQMGEEGKEVKKKNAFEIKNAWDLLWIESWGQSSIESIQIL